MQVVYDIRIHIQKLPLYIMNSVMLASSHLIIELYTINPFSSRDEHAAFELETSLWRRINLFLNWLLSIVYEMTSWAVSMREDGVEKSSGLLVGLREEMRG